MNIEDFFKKNNIAVIQGTDGKVWMYFKNVIDGTESARVLTKENLLHLLGEFFQSHITEKETEIENCKIANERLLTQRNYHVDLGLKYQEELKEKNIELQKWVERTNDEVNTHVPSLIAEISELKKAISQCEYPQCSIQPIAQLCPKCNGQGCVSKPPHIAGDVVQWASNQITHECNLCNGKMVIYPQSEIK